MSVVASRPAPRRQGRARVALVLALALLGACYRYRPEPLTSLRAGEVSAGTRVRLTYRNNRHEPVELDLEGVELPYVRGIVYLPGEAPGDRIPHHMRLDLRDVQSIEVQEIEGAKSVFAAVGGFVVLVGLVALSVAITLSGMGAP